MLLNISIKADGMIDTEATKLLNETDGSNKIFKHDDVPENGERLDAMRIDGQLTADKGR